MFCCTDAQGFIMMMRCGSAAVLLPAVLLVACAAADTTAADHRRSLLFRYAIGLDKCLKAYVPGRPSWPCASASSMSETCGSVVKRSS